MRVQDVMTKDVQLDRMRGRHRARARRGNCHRQGLVGAPRPRKRPARNNRHAVDAQASHAASETRNSDRHVVKGRAAYSTGEQP